MPPNKPILLSENSLNFPNPEDYDNQGLVAVGGDLSKERLLRAYQNGIFPWYEPGQPILWWSPDPRMILIPSEFKTSRSLKQRLKKPYRFTIDTAFSEVIAACATTAGRIGRTWITEEMIHAYCQLHQQGYAHSFEIWHKERLVGGLYGISLGHAFFGESMFYTIRDASKLAFYHLCETLLNWKFDFIDCQLPTKHLESLGAKPISRHDFLERLQQTLNAPTKQGLWTCKD